MVHVFDLRVFKKLKFYILLYALLSLLFSAISLLVPEPNYSAIGGNEVGVEELIEYFKPILPYIPLTTALNAVSYILFFMIAYYFNRFGRELYISRFVSVGQLYSTYSIIQGLSLVAYIGALYGLVYLKSLGLANFLFSLQFLGILLGLVIYLVGTFFLFLAWRRLYRLYGIRASLFASHVTIFLVLLPLVFALIGNVPTVYLNSLAFVALLYYIYTINKFEEWAKSFKFSDVSRKILKILSTAKGPVGVEKISKIIGLPREKIYEILYILKERGKFIGEIVEGKIYLKKGVGREK